MMIREGVRAGEVIRLTVELFPLTPRGFFGDIFLFLCFLLCFSLSLSLFLCCCSCSSKAINNLIVLIIVINRINDPEVR